MIPVVISGGSGTRLWPMSRAKWPKQFCDIFETSLMALSIKRAQRLGSPWILTSQNLRDLTEKSLKQMDLDQFTALYEPQAKNTAPALAFLCRYLQLKKRENEVVGVFPADQLVEKEDEFVKAIALAQIEANKGFVVTLGIQPDFAATGYGYIQTANEASQTEMRLQSFPVLQFHEKPSTERAEDFLRQRCFFWNAGIFVFKVSRMIELFKVHEPMIWQACEKLKEDLSNLDEIYQEFRNISIDYAVMEKLGAEELRCVPCNIGWSDVGSWDSVADILKTHVSNGFKIEVGKSENFVHGLDKKTYAFVDTDDLIVVDTVDALLVTKKGSTQQVKDVVEKLKLIKPQVVSDHVFEERPWGRFEVLKDTERFKSKVIHIDPFSAISYQSHAQREEHWLITHGKGEVVLEDKIIPVEPGTYVKIPLGAKHRIRNTTGESIEFIEVQLGSYFGEDDIIRYKDDYNRA